MDKNNRRIYDTVMIAIAVCVFIFAIVSVFWPTRSSKKTITKTLVENLNVKEAEYNMPEIKFKKIEYIKNPVLILEITFTDEFKENFLELYPDDYGFAVYVFMWDDTGWGWFNALLTQWWNLANSPKDWLNGVRTAKEVRKTATRGIPLYKPFTAAVNKDQRGANNQHRYMSFKNFIMRNQGERMEIGAYLSSVEWFNGWDIMKIVSMRIEYEWKHSAIKVRN